MEMLIFYKSLKHSQLVVSLRFLQENIQNEHQVTLLVGIKKMKVIHRSHIDNTDRFQALISDFNFIFEGADTIKFF